MKPEKFFDCVEVKHRGGQLIYEQLKIMTNQEELEFWDQATRELEVAKQKKHNQSLHPTV
ncbi:hypothetical protein [Gloeomargarita lithophora]|uniref:hypothetical protein n=1 Tax=Gloeomargarita lithophora TaxID=1188228 RepID=UPI0008F954D1|nr:hypothetical protein [Gloeomargarita lithophora]